MVDITLDLGNEQQQQSNLASVLEQRSAEASEAVVQARNFAEIASAGAQGKLALEIQAAKVAKEAALVKEKDLSFLQDSLNTVQERRTTFFGKLKDEAASIIPGIESSQDILEAASLKQKNMAIVSEKTTLKLSQLQSEAGVIDATTNAARVDLSGEVRDVEQVSSLVAARAAQFQNTLDIKARFLASASEQEIEASGKFTPIEIKDEFIRRKMGTLQQRSLQQATEFGKMRNESAKMSAIAAAKELAIDSLNERDGRALLALPEDGTNMVDVNGSMVSRTKVASQVKFLQQANVESNKLIQKSEEAAQDNKILMDQFTSLTEMDPSLSSRSILEVTADSQFASNEVRASAGRLLALNKAKVVPGKSVAELIALETELSVETKKLLKLQQDATVRTYKTVDTGGTKTVDFTSQAIDALNSKGIFEKPFATTVVAHQIDIGASMDNGGFFDTTMDEYEKLFVETDKQDGTTGALTTSERIAKIPVADVETMRSDILLKQMVLPAFSIAASELKLGAVMEVLQGQKFAGEKAFLNALTESAGEDLPAIINRTQNLISSQAERGIPGGPASVAQMGIINTIYKNALLQFAQNRLNQSLQLMQKLDTKTTPLDLRLNFPQFGPPLSAENQRAVDDRTFDEFDF